MSLYAGFKKDILGVDLFVSYKSFLAGVDQLLSYKLSNDVTELTEQLTDIESKMGRLIYIYAVAKALRDKAYADAWRNKGIIKRGETELFKAEVDDQIKEYTYLVTYLEYIIDAVKSRLALGKKLLPERM